VHKSDSEGVANVTTHRVLTRERTFLDEVSYKGLKIKLADFVHLSNPDDPSRPIVGQVFRCWVSEEP
jgi:chromatin structure-remodeling complex subunit RSC1/2